jgi:dienelactone hydrolase
MGRRLRRLAKLAAVLVALLLAAGAILVWRTHRRPAGLDEAVACRLGAYALSDGRTFVVRQREGDILRVVFFDGPSPAVSPAGDGNRFVSEARAENGSSLLTAELGRCGDATARVTLAGGAPETAQRVPLDERSVTFASAGVELAGKLVLPPGDAVVPVVVLVHGSERDSAILGDQWQYLLPAQGIGAFVYDKRGTGRSGGSYTQDFDLLAADAIAAARQARALAGARAGELGFLGGSQGGWIGPLAALRGGADFVVALYGLAESPLGEDREQVMTDLRDAGFGDAATLAKARELTAATGRVMASHFTQGFDELAAVERKYRGEPWIDKVEGEFSGQFIRYPKALLRTVGPLLDVGTSWGYEPMATLERIAVPQLWVLAGDDHEAPSDTTFALLRALQAHRPRLDVARFPTADHGILVALEGADGKVREYRYAPGYQPLVVDWIRTRTLRATPGAELYEGSG